MVLGRELQLPDAVAVLDPAAECDARSRQRSARHVVVDGREDPRFERPAAERRQPEADRSIELPLMLARRLHTTTIGLANQFGQLPPCLLGLPLEDGRLRARGLEQKLLPPLRVDLPEKLVDPLAVHCPILPGSHAASWSSATSTSSCSRAGRRKTTEMTIAATSSPPRTANAVWKPLTVAGAAPAASPWACA